MQKHITFCHILHAQVGSLRRYKIHDHTSRIMATHPRAPGNNTRLRQCCRLIQTNGASYSDSRVAPQHVFDTARCDLASEMGSVVSVRAPCLSDFRENDQFGND